MKVKIGPYRNWVGPYQITHFFLKPLGVSEDRRREIGEKLSNTFVYKVCKFFDNRKKRKIKVEIHDYDVWNVDSTLSLIIAPMLRGVRKNKDGAPYVDPEDTPENLRPTGPIDPYETDEFYFQRWNWVLEEMIFAFESLEKDVLGVENWEDKFYTGKADFKWEPTDETYDGGKVHKLTHGPEHTLKCDTEGRQKYAERIQNGFRLFGKYYMSLWT